MINCLCSILLDCETPCVYAPVLYVKEGLEQLAVKCMSYDCSMYIIQRGLYIHVHVQLI
jgi:hypothetical protein